MVTPTRPLSTKVPAQVLQRRTALPAPMPRSGPAPVPGAPALRTPAGATGAPPDARPQAATRRVQASQPLQGRPVAAGPSAPIRPPASRTPSRAVLAPACPPPQVARRPALPAVPPRRPESHDPAASALRTPRPGLPAAPGQARPAARPAAAASPAPALPRPAGDEWLDLDAQEGPGVAAAALAAAAPVTDPACCEPVVERPSRPAREASTDEGLQGLDDVFEDRPARSRSVDTAPASGPQAPNSRLLLYTALGASCAAFGRWITLTGSAVTVLDIVGPILLAGFLGAFTALGIGLADETRLTSSRRRIAYTTLSGAVIGTLGTFGLVAPIFGARAIFLRLVLFSLAIGLAGALCRVGLTQVLMLAAAGLGTGYVSSVGLVSRWIDPSSPAPWAMAATFGLMGLSVGMARWMAGRELADSGDLAA